MKNNYLMVFLAALLMGCAQQPATQSNTPVAAKPKNIIVLIGDGMGVSQVSAAYYLGSTEPNFSRFPYVGLSNTTSASHKITDSAAGGTALASGRRTYNGAIGVEMDSVTAIRNIVEILSEQGYQTGVISTSAITHATPASYYGHVKLRSMQYELAVQLAASEIDFFAGGGKQYFRNRKDGTHVLAQLTAAGFVVDTTALPTTPTAYQANRKYGYLVAEDGLPNKHKGRGDFLPNALKEALAYFASSNKPFFLMVEASQIDWAGHNNHAEYLAAEVLDFDKTIGVALDFAAQNTETLVLVTADHETGGYTLAAKVNADGHSDYNVLDPQFATGGHSCTMVPVFAYGPKAQAFAGVYPNTAICQRILN